ncbi:hypothetical protein BV25DRAFT_1915387 [Artomyces pyxidatus]|uniref:Uncharacterized protein n=1 Tax=Artomyces pyxidatus TaxID=48021 RepID=A0ACB8T4L0_9AGAM|nr:hypothetical protein BV25DRAFT_1915387 [Artomyces pyxidatus]
MPCRLFPSAAAPSTALPPELLTRVFTFAVRLDPPRMSAAMEKHLGWIRVSHVCRYWRDVALGARILWRHIDIGELSHRWHTEMLGRSGATPLHITSGSPRPGPIDVLPDVLDNHFFRIAELDVVVSPENDGTCDRLGDIFTPPAPLLEEVRIESCSASMATMITPDQTGDGAAGFAPKLRSISLYDCRFSFYRFPIYPRLTYLAITMNVNKHPYPFVELNTSQSQRLNNFISSLQGMPCLESLILQGCLPCFIAETLPRDVHHRPPQTFLSRSLWPDH